MFVIMDEALTFTDAQEECKVIHSITPADDCVTDRQIDRQTERERERNE
jgi:hypothetical protein